MQLPRPESRLSTQERLTSLLVARVEEVAQDTENGIKQLSQKLDDNFREVKRDMEGSFKQVDAYFQMIENDTAELRATQAKHSERFDKIERVQTEHSERFDKIERVQTEHSDLLREILARLPKTPSSE
jgi:tRNA U34 5-carboxymethylaminomethyl modifying GTPase MnmE/TrmE